MAIHEIRHPLIRHKLGLLRRADISTKNFRELAQEVTMLLTYEATKDLPMVEHDIDGWNGAVTVDRIAGKKITVVPILRAGIGMLELRIQLAKTYALGDAAGCVVLRIEIQHDILAAIILQPESLVTCHGG